jgi:hypothetical protein
MRDKVWGFVNITSTNIHRIEMICTDSGAQFFQTRELVSNEMITTLDTTRKRIPAKIIDGKLQLEGFFYTDTPLITADSKAELMGFFSAERDIVSAYIYYSR